MPKLSSSDNKVRVVKNNPKFC